MGMNEKGGPAPASYDWTWDVKRNQDAAWVGTVNAGLQFTLKDQHYIRPLNTNFYQLRPLVMPDSWDNGGKGAFGRRTGNIASAAPAEPAPSHPVTRCASTFG
jgi:hypothetical protein